MGNLKSYAGQFLLVFAAVLAANWASTQMNKPKTAAPKTTA